MFNNCWHHGLQWELHFPEALAAGTFKPLGFVAAALPNSVQQRNRNTGTYRLK